MTKEEQLTSVANNVIDSLRNQPLVIGMLVLNVIFLAVLGFTNYNASNNRHDELLEVMSQANTNDKDFERIESYLKLIIENQRENRNVFTLEKERDKEDRR